MHAHTRSIRAVATRACQRARNLQHGVNNHAWLRRHSYRSTSSDTSASTASASLTSALYTRASRASWLSSAATCAPRHDTQRSTHPSNTTTNTHHGYAGQAAGSSATTWHDRLAIAHPPHTPTLSTRPGDRPRRCCGGLGGDRVALLDGTAARVGLCDRDRLRLGCCSSAGGRDSGDGDRDGARHGRRDVNASARSDGRAAPFAATPPCDSHMSHNRNNMS